MYLNGKIQSEYILKFLDDYAFLSFFHAVITDAPQVFSIGTFDLGQVSGQSCFYFAAFNRGEAGRQRTPRVQGLATLW